MKSKRSAIGPERITSFTSTSRNGGKSVLHRIVTELFIMHCAMSLSRFSIGRFSQVLKKYLCGMEKMP